MPPAARVGDQTDHPGVISGPGVATVLIGGQPAAVLAHGHVCAFPSPSSPHPPTAVVNGSRSVFIGGRPAARVGDETVCDAAITSGLATVLIGG